MTASVGSAVSRKLQMHKQKLLDCARDHECARHPLFDALAQIELSVNQCGALLRNYDAHAAVLRRLLLRAATIMPEKAVGFILENVRNEYGNGKQEHRHELQLLDLAHCAGVSRALFDGAQIQQGVRDYLKTVVEFYNPRGQFPERFFRPAIAAGAITATEILALEEFRAMQKAFARRNLQNHVWFDHVNVEAEHTDESLALALFFIEEYQQDEAVYFGLNGVLDANCRLYDGLLAALHATR